MSETNTMDDLKRIVQRKLQHLDGEWVENPKKMDIGMMLGVSESFPTSHRDTEGSILDTAHPFWELYVRDIASANEAMVEVRVAVQLLKDENKFRLDYADADDNPGASITVLPVTAKRNNNLPTEYEFVLEPRGRKGNLTLKVRGPDGVWETTLHRA